VPVCSWSINDRLMYAHLTGYGDADEDTDDRKSPEVVLPVATGAALIEEADLYGGVTELAQCRRGRGS
jgi:hypothetical protein